ncbi:MAG: hypothetical protein AB2813_10085 [Candidatus Sedimenticola endophacoides]
MSIRPLHYYGVFLLGRNRRSLSRREAELARGVKAVILLGVLTFSTLMGLLVLYLLKSALGINLLPDHSLGLWESFREVFR